MANYVNLTKGLFNPYNPRVLNEGQFSWFTQDTGRQIGSERSNTIDVWMFDNQGNSWFEKGYEGYGKFGGMDYYELLARMNGYSEEDLEGRQELRGIGIDLAFDKLKTKDKGKKVLFPALIGNPTRFNHKRHDFTQEADSDPNQSWSESVNYAEKDEALNEWGSSDQSIMNKAIHNDAGKPKQMPSPFDKKLRAAAENAVDFYWDDWEEYEDDRDGLIDDAVRGYLRQYFKKDFEVLQRMFQPMESVKVDEARDWGTFGEFADDKKSVSTVTKTLDKALAKFEAALTKAHADYQKAIKDFTTGSKADMGRSSGFHDSEGPASVHHYTKQTIKKAFNMDEWGGGLDYKVGWMFEGLTWYSLKESLGLNEARYDKKKLLKAIKNLDDAIILVKGKEYIIYNPNNNNDDSAAMWGDKTIFALDQDGDEYEIKYSDIERFSESVVNERSINKIQKEYSQVVMDMSKTVEEWKAADGDRKAELLAKLKELTNTKHKLHNELDVAVAGKDKDLQLAISESNEEIE